jgi:hypothetical protein
VCQKQFPSPWYVLPNCAPIWRRDSHYLQIDQNEVPLDSRHLRILLGAPKMIFEPVARSAQTVHLYCIEINSISEENEMSFHLTHVTYLPLRLIESKQTWCPWYVPLGAAKNISVPVKHSAQTVHLSSTEINSL